MSFSDLLWDNFEVVNRHALDHRKGTEDLLQVFRDIASLYDAFGRGMEKLSTSSYSITNTEGSLSHAVASLKTDCANKADQAKILVESISNDLIEPLRDLLKNQNNNIKKPTTEGKKVEKEMQGYAEKLEKSKARYYKACEECEQLTIVLENKMNKEKRLKLMAKLVAVKREVEASLKLYQESLAASNAYKERYKSMMMKILEVYQKQEEQRLESIKDMLRKLVVYQTSFLRNLQYDVDNLAHAMESINIKSDIRKYIDDNATGKIDAPAEEFVPYKGNHPAFQNLGSSAPMYTIPINESDDTLVSKVKKWVENSIANHAEEEVKQVMFSILDKFWRGIGLEPVEKLLYKMLIRERLGRKVWCWIIQSKKSKGSYGIPEESYRNICEMFIEVLDEVISTQCQRFCDSITGKSILSFIQSFYKENSDPAAAKEFLQDTVSRHEVWGDMLFWEGIICEAIDEEFRLQNEYYMIDAEDEENKVIRLKNIVFCQLGTYANIMMGFEVNKEATAEMVSKYGCRYELSFEDIETLNVRDIQRAILRNGERVIVPEIVHEVQRGKPKWMEELENRTAQIAEKLKGKEVISEEVGMSNEDTESQINLEESKEDIVEANSEVSASEQSLSNSTDQTFKDQPEISEETFSPKPNSELADQDSST